MVCGDHRDAPGLANRFQNPTEAQINCGHGNPDRRFHPGMADHVAIGQVQPDKTVRPAGHGGHDLVRDLGGLHPRSQVKGDLVRRNLFVFFQSCVDVSGAVSVPEIGDVAEFLRFRNRVRGEPRPAEIFPEGALNGRGFHQEILRYQSIAVILHYSGIEDLGHADTLKLGEIRFLESPGYFNGPVAAKIEENHGVSILDCAHGAARVGHHEAVHILICDVQVFLIICPDCLGCRGESPALAKDMGLPALFHHLPVGVVTVHGGGHAPASRGDPVIAPADGQGVQPGFQRLNIAQGAFLVDVPSVQQGMHSDPG